MGQNEKFRTLKYRGFQIAYKQTPWEQPNWFVIVHYADGRVDPAIGSKWTATEESAIEQGKAVVDKEIEWWAQNRENPELCCPYPDSLFE